MIHIEVRCKDCGRLLDEAPDLAGEQRQPCPSCGSLGRQRSVMMVPGEAGAAPGTAEAAWLDLGAALARAASALDQLLADELPEKDRGNAEQARTNIQQALEEYREADRGPR